MVKTDDYLIMEEGGGTGAVAVAANNVIHTTPAAFVGKPVAATKGGGEGTKMMAGGEGEHQNQLMMVEEMEQDGAAMMRHHHNSWLPPRSKSAGINKCSSGDYDESDESGGDQNSKPGERNKFTPSTIDSSELDDRRLRRQIANCNERRRMQSINAGFQALRQLLPRKDGDKMSKAAILAATADFIQCLLREKEEQNAAMAKKRRLDNEDQNNGLEMVVDKETSPANVLDCLRTISELRSSLQKETQLRMAYEKEMVDMRRKLSSGSISADSVALQSPGGFSSPNSSSSTSSSTSAFMPPPSDHRGLLVELARQQQHQQQEIAPQPLYRPTPILPSDVQILSSAIASLAAKTTPGSAATEFRSPIGINNSTRGNSNGQLFVATRTSPAQGNLIIGGAESSANNNSLFGGIHGRQPHFSRQEHPSATDQSATISQRNLQALVLAIRHLEDASGNSAAIGGNNSTPCTNTSSSSSASSNNNLLVQ